MMISNKLKLIIFFIILLIFISIAWFLFFTNKEFTDSNSISDEELYVKIVTPKDKASVFHMVVISGNVNYNENNKIIVEVKINNNSWMNARINETGLNNWSYVWDTYNYNDGLYDIQVRAYDGINYSRIQKIGLYVDNPIEMLSSEHKWALFVAADNFPKDNESKLGNGGLYLAENMSAYLIEDCGFSTSNIIILFDDGWIRGDNGYGNPIQTLDERPHKYRIDYSRATKENVNTTINYIIEESNKYEDSEVFIWFFGHGYGNNSLLAGGKILERSAIFLWDDIITDKELGILLSNLNSKKTCIIIDSCYSGGFADKTIFNLPEPSILTSGISKPGRVVITGESKFRPGYAVTTTGPVFSQIWFYGLETGSADGFRPSSVIKINKPNFYLIQDERVSVEEAYYFTRFMLKAQMSLKEFSQMEPEINDKYPNRGVIMSMGGFFL